MTYSISDFRRDMRQPYAWPGGYPRFFITSDGAALSFASAKRERRAILASILDNPSAAPARNDGWRVVACDINWEDGDLVCDHSGERIESAYAD